MSEVGTPTRLALPLRQILDPPLVTHYFSNWTNGSHCLTRHLPKAMTQSIPDLTRDLANIRALDPDEQLLFTLKTGMPVSPSSYTAFCPQVGSP